MLKFNGLIYFSGTKIQAYVGNISYRVSEEDLREFFRENNPTEVKIIMDTTYTPARSRGFGFVTFSSDVDLNNALEVII